LKLPAANALAQQELHGFFALRANRGRGVFGHDAHAGSGASATNSLSPIAAGTGAVMAKFYRFKKRVVCPVTDSKIDSPVLQGMIDLILSLFDRHRSAYPRQASFACAVAKLDFPSPAEAISQLNDGVFYSPVVHGFLRNCAEGDLGQNNSGVSSLVNLPISNQAIVFSN
jgi:hypothetical protein